MVVMTYASLVVPMQIAWGPLLSTIPALYVTFGSVSLRQIGVAMMLLRLMDVLIDPLIGLFSDRTWTPWGRRKPWLLAGALVMMPAAWALFGIPGSGGIAYFAVSMGLVYVGWSMMEIPHLAWLGELSHGDAGRAALSGWRTAAAGAGSMLYLAIPLLPGFADAAMTPAVMAVARVMLLGLLAVALALTMRWLPDGSAGGAARPAFGASFQALARSRAMRMLCGSLLLGSLASGMCGACYFFYIGTYLGIAGSFATIGVVGYVLKLLSGPVLPQLISRIGKRAGLAISNGASLFALVGMAMIPRGRGAAVAVIVLFAVTSIFTACGGVAVPVIAVDAASDDEECTGSNNLGSFTAATVLCGKVGVAVGGGIAFLLLGSFGFNPKDANGAGAMAGFDLTLFVVPGLLYLAAAVAAMRVPEAKRDGWDAGIGGMTQNTARVMILVDLGLMLSYIQAIGIFGRRDRIAVAWM